MISARHSGQFIKAVSALTIDPYKNLIYYFFPVIGAQFSAYPIQPDPEMMPEDHVLSFLKIVEEVTKLVKMKKVISYTLLHFEFASYGGRFSLLNPVLFVPYQCMFWKYYTADEIRFLIAKELTKIQANSGLIVPMIKVLLIAVLFTY